MMFGHRKVQEEKTQENCLKNQLLNYVLLEYSCHLMMLKSNQTLDLEEYFAKQDGLISLATNLDSQVLLLDSGDGLNIVNSTREQARTIACTVGLQLCNLFYMSHGMECKFLKCKEQSELIKVFSFLQRQASYEGCTI